MPCCMWNASEHHFVLAFESVMSEKRRAPQWALVRGLHSVGLKRQDYVSGISHSGDVPEVGGSGWEGGERCSLQWHLDLDGASRITAGQQLRAMQEPCDEYRAAAALCRVRSGGLSRPLGAQNQHGEVTYTKHDTSLSNALECQTFTITRCCSRHGYLPLYVHRAYAVSDVGKWSSEVCWWSRCFPSLHPDSAASGAREGETPCHVGNKHWQERLTGNDGVGWELGGGGGDWERGHITFVKNNKVETRVRKETRLAAALRREDFPQIREARSDTRQVLKRNFVEVKGRNININANRRLWCPPACLNSSDCLNQTDQSVWRICDRWESRQSRLETHDMLRPNVAWRGRQRYSYKNMLEAQRPVVKH